MFISPSRYPVTPSPRYPVTSLPHYIATSFHRISRQTLHLFNVHKETYNTIADEQSKRRKILNEQVAKVTESSDDGNDDDEKVLSFISNTVTTFV